MSASARWLVCVALLAGCAAPAPHRPERQQEELNSDVRAESALRVAQTRDLMDRLMARADAKARGEARPTIDLLIISGGGDWGAFGAGVLKGWGRVKGELARPQFDVVTGVSTGALIAPFAFLGDDASIERVVQLYRNPVEDIAVSRGWLFFLPNNPSLYLLPGLERELRASLDRPVLERLVAERASGRALLVNTTNIDLGQSHAWDVLDEARAPASPRSFRRARSRRTSMSTVRLPATSCMARACPTKKVSSRAGRRSTRARLCRSCAIG